MTDLFFRNRRLLALAVALITVSGLTSFYLLPRREDPELSDRYALIVTRFPGASAERVEALVTKKLEDELLGMEEIRQINSSSRAGISVVMVELKEEVTNTKETWSEVRAKVDDAELHFPPNAHKPDFDVIVIDAWTIITALTWTSDAPINHAVLRRHSKELEDVLRRVPGTAATDVFGETQEEVLIQLDAGKMASLGLNVREVSRAVQEADPKVPAGRLYAKRHELLLEVQGELDSVTRLRRIPVRRSKDGRIVRLGDIATVQKTVQDPAREMAMIGGKRGISVAARISSDQRVDVWSQKAHGSIEQFSSTLPEGVSLQVIFDQSQYTEDRLDNLFGNLLLGAGLILLVVFLLMGWRSAILVAASLPLAVLMVLSGMRVLGVPLHQMSVTGLIVALGLLIDNAIVMVDEVRHRRRMGASPSAAVSGSVKMLRLPLLGSTLTTIFAFLPIYLMPGAAGEFVGTIALSVILAIVSSFLLAMTIVPAMTALLDRIGAKSSSGFLRDGLSHPWLTSAYRTFLGALLSRPVLAIALAAVLPVVGFVKSRELDEQFFPPTERNQFPISLRMPPQTSMEETRRVAMEARERILKVEGVEEVHWFMGTSAPKFYYNMMIGQDDTASYAQALVQLKTHRGAIELIRSLQVELDRTFPQGRFVVRNFEQGPPIEAPVEILVYGPETDLLRTLGEELRGELAQVPGVVHTRTKFAEVQPKLALNVDEEEANLAGFRLTDIAQRLEAHLDGSFGGSVLEGTEELPVRTRIRGGTRSNLENISSLEFSSPESKEEWTPLSSFASFDLQPSASVITRRNGRRVNILQAYVLAGTLPANALAGFKKRTADRLRDLPPGYEVEVGGNSEARSRAIDQMLSTVPVLLVLMVTVLVLSFGSFRLAAIVGVVAALCVGVAFGILWLFGYPFGFMAIVGTMGLIGVAINDTIVVLAAIRNDKRAAAGDREAVIDVVVRSTKHVIATSITTLVGFTPLILVGGGFWPPVALTIGAGVFGATFLALILAPAAYLLTKTQHEPIPSVLSA